MNGRGFTEDDKAAALAALAANAGNVSKTARDLGIPRTTLSRWSNGERISDGVTAKAQVKKAALADELENVARALVGAMPAKIADATLQQSATALGITVEQMLLLRGEATGNTAMTIEVVYTNASLPTDAS